MKILNVDSYEDDMTFNIYPPDVVTATNEGEFIAVLSPYYLLKNNKEYLTELKDKTRSDWEKYNSQIRGVSEGDNPVIGFYKLKDF